MFTLPMRVCLVVVGTSYGIYKIVNGYQSGYALLFAVSLLVFGYFRYGAIRPAFMAMMRGDLDVARENIESIKYPRLLSAQSKAYFHWTNAVLAAEDSNDLLHAEREMRLAISGALRTSHDRCLATATLAQIIAQGNDLERAKQLLADAEEIPHRDTASDYLDEVRSKFKQLSGV